MPAEAVTLRDLVDLSKQGISDDILIALVEAEKSVFYLSAVEVKTLKEQGLSDRLVIHLLQTPALRPAPEPVLHLASQRPEPAQAPAREVVDRVVVVDRVETVAVPVYVPVPVASERRVRDRDRDDHDRDRDRDEKPASPVYWGYGGKLRPGSWKDR